MLEKLQLKDEIFDKLGESFRADPTGMSVKNLAVYFQTVTDLEKDSNPQAVFDLYDDIADAVGTKPTGHAL